MARTDSTGGAREHRVADWPFGGPGRRLLLDVLLRGDSDADGFAKKELEGLAGVAHGGLDTVLPGAVHLGLVEVVAGRWRPCTPGTLIGDALTALLAVADDLPDEQIRALPRRGYRRR